MSECFIYRTSGSFVKNIDKFSNIVYDLFKDNISNLNKEHSIENIKKMITSNNFYGIFVYDDQSDLIGYILGQFEILDDSRYCYFIKYIYVVSEYRGQNIGTALLTRLKYDIKHEFGVNYIMVFSNVNDTKIYDFYIKNNFSTDILYDKKEGYKSFLSRHFMHIILSIYL
jgi:GNAT superfamily N-acetyltransferase